MWSWAPQGCYGGGSRATTIRSVVPVTPPRVVQSCLRAPACKGGDRGPPTCGCTAQVRCWLSLGESVLTTGRTRPLPSSASSCAYPRCSISRDPRSEEHTTCAAVAPDVVFTARMYRTRPLNGPRLVREFSSRSPQTHRSAPRETRYSQIVAQLGNLVMTAMP